MAQSVRRSWLLIPSTDRDLLDRSWTFDADVVVLDLEDLVHDSRKHEARTRIRDGIESARRGGAEVFVRCDRELLYADLEASVWRGLACVILPKVTAAAEVHEAEAILARFEAERGVRKAGIAGEVDEVDEPRTPESALEIQLSLENAPGNHNAASLLQASPRVRSVSLGRVDLVMDLRPEPSGELHLLPYLMQRLIMLAGAAAVTPIGAWWNARSRGLRAGHDDTLAAAELGRAAGFKGALCVDPEQVAALNQGFTPTAEEVARARNWIGAFEDRPAGRHFAEVDGLLVDGALAAAAYGLLAWADACAERERSKAQALGRPGGVA